jgi:hypothetical protein
MNVSGLLLRSLGCLLVSNALSSFTGRNCCRLLVLLVLEVDTRDRKPVPSEDVRCFSIAQHGTSQKCSHHQRRHSKFNYGFHFCVRFPCKRICAHRYNPGAPPKPSENEQERPGLAVIVRLPESESSVYMSRDDCLEQGIRSSVWVTLLAINALMLLIEAAIGWLAQSSALLADSLDMLADAAVFEILRNAKSTVPREVVSEES